MASKTVVDVTAKHVILSAHGKPPSASTFPLGPLDSLVLPIVPISVVFVYDNSVDLNRLKSAIALLLDAYPHLSGRVVMRADGVPEITKLGTGALLIEAECQQPLHTYLPLASKASWTMAELPDGGNDLLPPFDLTNLDGELLSVQWTRFACGKTALGIRTRHITCDAAGYFQLVEDLGTLYRQLGQGGAAPKLPVAPCIHSHLVEDLSADDRAAALKFAPALFHLDDETGKVVDETAKNSSPPAVTTASIQPPVTGRFLRFSGNELAALKAHASENLPEDTPWISTFDALCAHIYRHIHRARVKLRRDGSTAEPLTSTDILTPVDLRPRLPDVLPPRYFPNALLCAYTNIPEEVLADGPLSKVASIVHNMTRGPGTAHPDHIQNTLRWIAALPDKSRLRQTGFTYGSGSLMLSQWSRFDPHAAVFEAPPVLVGPPFTASSLLDGLGYLLPLPLGAADEHGIEVALALSDPLWTLIDADSEFRRFQ